MVFKQLIFCLFLIHVNGEIASSDGSVTRSHRVFNEDEVLAKIDANPITPTEQTELTGGLFRGYRAREINGILLGTAIETIAFSELRSALGFRLHKQSGEKFSEIEMYYETNEPWTVPNRTTIDEGLVAIYVKYVDERYPGIREIFKRRFSETRRALSWSKVDKKTVDAMINTHRLIVQKIFRPFTPDFTSCTVPYCTGHNTHSVNWGCSNKTCNAKLNMEEELPEVFQCLVGKDLSWDSTTKFIHSPRFLESEILFAALESIGLSEFRSVLHMAPPHRWTEWTEQQPITPSMSIEEYVEATEPRSFFRWTHKTELTDTFVSTAVAFMEQHYPGLRGFFHRKFQGIVEQAGKKIDRETIDLMNETFVVIVTKVREVVIHSWFNC